MAKKSKKKSKLKALPKQAFEDKDVWLIAYINRSYISIANEELESYEYDEIEAYIPTVRLLKKQFKGKQVFEFVPLLFNYGFFKMPYEKACNTEYISELRQRITCIYGWVKDPIKAMGKNPHLRVDNEGLIKAIPKAALATDEEVSRLIKASDSMSIYNTEDLDRIKAGDYIKLEGYPFDGMPAEILSINKKKREVVVKLLLDVMVKKVTVSFDNVFYSVYKNFKEEGRESSTDALKENYGQNAVDYLTHKQNM